MLLFRKCLFTQVGSFQEYNVHFKILIIFVVVIINTTHGKQVPLKFLRYSMLQWFLFNKESFTALVNHCFYVAFEGDFRNVSLQMLLGMLVRLQSSSSLEATSLSGGGGMGAEFGQLGHCHIHIHQRAHLTRLPLKLLVWITVVNQ